MSILDAVFQECSVFYPSRNAVRNMTMLDAGFVLFYNRAWVLTPKAMAKEVEDMALPETIRKAAKEKAYIRRYALKYNIHTDADIIEHLSKQPSMQGYIKRLIREDIERNSGQQ